MTPVLGSARGDDDTPRFHNVPEVRASHVCGRSFLSVVWTNRQPGFTLTAKQFDIGKAATNI